LAAPGAPFGVNSAGQKFRTTIAADQHALVARIPALYELRSDARPACVEISYLK
jgi:hypothetical protein